MQKPQMLLNSSARPFFHHHLMARPVLRRPPLQVRSHQIPGVFVLRSQRTDALATRNLDPGAAVYGEKLVTSQDVEYRVWNPYRSKLGAAIIGAVSGIEIKPGARVLYLGAASGTTVSHVSDLVGDAGVVYAVEFSHRCGRDLLALAQRRPNIVPIIEDARHPARYRALVSAVDVVFADVAQPDQARILAINAKAYLLPQGSIILSIKANCVDSTAAPETVYASEIRQLRAAGFKPIEQLGLEPYHRDHCVVTARYVS